MCATLCDCRYLLIMVYKLWIKYNTIFLNILQINTIVVYYNRLCILVFSAVPHDKI